MEKDILLIKRRNTVDKYERLFSTVEKILRNLTENSTQDKFYKLNGKIGGTIDKHILEIEGGVELLKKFGFYRQIIDFQPYYIKQDILSGRMLHMFKDYHKLFQEEVEKLEVRKKSSERVDVIEKARESREKFIENVMLHYDEDRLDKIQTTKKEHERIKKEKQRKDEELKKQMNQQRLELVQKKQADELKKKDSDYIPFTNYISE